MAISRRTAVLITVAIVVMIGVAYFGHLLDAGFQSITYQAATQEAGCDPALPDPYFNAYGSGAYPLVPGQSVPDKGAGAGELMDSDVYWMSWLPGVASQTVAAQGYIRSCQKSLTGASFTDFTRYRVSQSNTGLPPWHTVKNLDLPNGFVAFQDCGLHATAPLNGFTFHLYGQSYTDEGGNQQPILDGSILRVDLDFGFINDSCTGVQPTDSRIVWTNSVASDESQLRNSLPTGYFSNYRSAPNSDANHPLYQVGDQFQFHWTIPTVQIGNAYEYTLTITNDNTGTPVSGYSATQMTTKTGLAAFTVTSDMFSNTTTLPNSLTVTIQGAIVNGFQQKIATIDDVTKAPALVSVVVTPTKAAYQQGDVISIAVAAKPNANTNLPITKSAISMTINGQTFSGSDQTTANEVKNSDGSYTATFSDIRIPFSGILNVQGVSYDSANRPTGWDSKDYFVGNAPPDMCQLYPNLSECQTPSFIVPLWVYTAIAAAILVLLAYFNPADYIPAVWRLLLILIAVILVFVTLVFAGVLHF